jgi:Asp23 family, cell envelope-related function
VHLFNRLLLVLLALGLVVAAGAVVLVALGLAPPAALAPAPWFADRLAPFAGLDPVAWGWTVGVGLALVLLGLLVLVLELRPGPREEPRLTLKRDGLGTVTVTRSGVRQVVEREAGRVAGVVEARARVQEGDRGLRVDCRVAVDPAADIPAVTEAVQARVKAAVEHAVGRPVAEVRVDAQVEPLGGAPRRRPAARCVQ